MKKLKLASLKITSFQTTNLDQLRGGFDGIIGETETSCPSVEVCSGETCDNYCYDTAYIVCN